MAPIDYLLITTVSKKKKVAAEVAKIQDVTSANPLDGLYLRDRVLAKVYTKSRGKTVNVPKRVDEIIKEIGNMHYVTDVHSLGIANTEYKRDKKGNIKEKLLK